MNFENKFNELNAKIEIKAKHTLNTYEKYFEDINQRYGSELESFIQNSINNQRDALLTELIQKRTSQINKINESCNETLELETYFSTYKQEWVYFKKNIEPISVNNFKFTRTTNLLELDKYSKFLLTTNRIRLNLPNDHFIKALYENQKMILLSSNLIFVCASVGYKTKMMTFNKNGLILNTKVYSYTLDKLIKATSTYIVRLFEVIAKTGTKNIIKTYDFKLNPVNKLEINSYCYDFCLNNDELMFRGFGYFIITVYSIKNLKISLYIRNSFSYSSKFFSFNREYLYFLISNDRFGYKRICIMNRIGTNENRFIDISLESINDFELVKFDMKSCIYYLDKNKKLIHVYESESGSLLYDIQLLDDYKSLHFSILDTILLNQKVTCKYIEYDEY